MRNSRIDPKNFKTELIRSHSVISVRNKNPHNVKCFINCHFGRLWLKIFIEFMWCKQFEIRLVTWLLHRNQQGQVGEMV